MEKNKRTDLLAAGRKKLMQFRQKKGGGKDGKSSSKGNKLEKDADAEEPEEPGKIPEPAPTSSAAITSTTPVSSPDPSVAAEDVDSQAIGSVPAIDGDVPEDERDSIQVLTEPNDGGGAQVTAEVDHEEDNILALKKHDGKGTQAGILSADNGNDETGAGVAPVALDSDGLEVAISAETSSEPAMDKEVVRPVFLAVERNDGEQGPLSLAENSETTFPVTKNQHENLEKAGKVSPELKMPEEANGIPIPVEAIQEFNADANPDCVEMQVQVTLEGGTSLEEGLDDLEQNQDASVDSIVLEQNVEVPPSDNASTRKMFSHEENLEIPSLMQVSPSLGKQEDSDKHDEETVNETVEGGVQLFREVVNVQSKLAGEIPEKGFLSHREMFRGIKEEDHHSGSKSTDLVPSLDLLYIHRFLSENEFYDGLENIKKHLYLTSVTRDFLQLQLDENNEMNAQFCQQSYELTKLWTLVKETQENNATVNEELAQSRFQLQAATVAKEELEIQLQTKQEEIEELYNKASMLQSKLDSSQEELVGLSSELAVCKVSLDMLQKENLNLTASLTVETDVRKKFEGEKESLASENARLASELLEQKERLLVALDKQIQLECNLREAGSYFEQLTEQNLYLSNSLDIHKIKIKELGNEHYGLPFLPEKMEGQTNYPILDIATDGAPGDSQSNGSWLQNVDGEDSDSSVILGFLKGQLKEVKSILHNLEKLIDTMHSQSQSLSRSGGRTSSSGVSKLIQAFESKTVVGDNTSQEVQSTDGGQSDDSYSSTKEQTYLLSDMLEQIDLVITKLEANVLKEQNSRSLLRNCEMENLAQKQQHDILQVRFDELAHKLSDYRSRIDFLENKFDEVQQCANDEAAKFIVQLEMLQDKVKDTESVLKQERDSIIGVILSAIKKLDGYTGLPTPGDTEIDAHVMASVDAATNTFDILHKKLHDANLNYETIQKSHAELNELFTGAQGSNELVIGHIDRLYVMLKQLLQESCISIGELDVDVKDEELLQLLPERCQMFIAQLQKLLDERKLLLSENNELESRWLGQNEEIEKLNQRCNDLMKELADLHYAKDGLESVLTNKNEFLEEVSRRCLALARKLDQYQSNKDPYDMSGLAGGDELAMTCESMESYLIRSLIPHLEALAANHLQKYEEIVEHVNLSKDYLLEINVLSNVSVENWSMPLPTFIKEEFVPKVWELKDQLDFLIASNIKHGAELQIYKDYSIRIMNALESSRSELLLKISELEQSEQRLSSVREKLSIAVAKGKGLVVQRDSLKQSLLEKSSALEKCSQELQCKEVLLKEVEAKLKSYSEVDRIEALESELSYIRNSATALRDSFLLKDSILQRIEEALEYLDLPDSKDIVEKIELMSRLISSNPSFITADWAKKHSMEETHSDEGFVVMEDCRTDPQATSYPAFHELQNKNDDLERKFYGLTEQKEILAQSPVERDRKFDELKYEYKDLERRFYGLAEHKEMLEQSLVERGGKFNDLKNRYEDLERRFYELAEHNEMLEQSLVERNSLVQKWEEVLDRIHVPPHSMTLEPIDKIEWLRDTVSEVRQERNALQLKIENLEASADTLSVNIEDSHKKISELSAELVAIKREKGFLSDSQDKIMFENHELSERVMQDLNVRNALQKDLVELQNDLAEKVQEFFDLENEIWRLLDLVGSTLDDDNKPERLSEGSAISYLEGSLRKLIHEYTTLISERTMPKDAQDLLVSEDKKLTSDKTTSGDVLDVSEQELNNLRLELNAACSNVDLLKEEKNELMEKCNSLMLENEGLRQQELLSEEDRKSDKERNQCMVSEMEVLHIEKDALQEQLTQEEQKYASTREKLNVAVRKGKALVQQRDSLKQAIEEMKSMMEHFKSENNQQIEALESEKLLLVTKLTETEQNLQISRNVLSRLLTVMDGIHLSSEIEINDPVQKLEELGNLYRNLLSVVDSSEQEAKKSKRAADLLLTELNEVQERADILQEELIRAQAGRDDVLHRLEQISLVHSEESKKQIDNLTKLDSAIDQLREVYFETNGVVAHAFTRDVDLFCYMDNFMESINKQLSSNVSLDLPSSNALTKEYFRAIDSPSEPEMHEQADGLSISKQLDFSVHHVLRCAKNYDELKRNIQRYSFSVDQQSARLLKMMDSLGRKFSSQREECESLRRDLPRLELLVKEKENENAILNSNLALLYQACCTSITEIEIGNSQKAKENPAFGKHDFPKAAALDLKLWNPVDRQGPHDGTALLFPEELIRSLSDKLLATVKGAKVNVIAEGNLQELKSTLSELRKELQEKDFQMNRVCQDLVSQIRDAEAVAKRYSLDLDSAKATIQELEKQIKVMENQNNLLKSRVGELEDSEASASESQGRIKSLTDALMAKDQEIEAFMQALDEEETQLAELENKNKELENLVQEKDLTVENLEASRAKTLAKLSTTVCKFDELHNLSESLLAEVENLQSQSQAQDSEISFLRQEATRCTNDLLSSQEIAKKYLSEIHELLKWLDMMVSLFGLTHIPHDDDECTQVRSYTDILGKTVASLVAELDDLRLTIQSKDALLQTEKVRVEELLCKFEVLETSLREKENQIKLVPESRSSGQTTSWDFSGPSEIEQMKNKPVSGAIVTHVRSGRRVNGDQLSIAIDSEKDDNILDDDDDDKAHGFKSLTKSRFIPRVSRPITDRIDAIWVSGDRLLMRQPTLRLAVVVYWIAMHALLVSLI